MTASNAFLMDDSAICGQVDPELFFPAKGETWRPAVKLCQSCPLIDACLTYAIEWDVYGVWGGSTTSQRRKYRRSRGLTATPLVASQRSDRGDLSVVANAVTFETERRAIIAENRARIRVDSTVA